MDTKEFINKQIQEMDRHKWLESEKAGYDRGEEALLEWAEKHSKTFTTENSLRTKSD
jgi:hypothetical protein